MKFTIISIDDSRIEYKNKIRQEMAGVEEVDIKCLDARPVSVNIEEELADLGLHISDKWVHMPPKRGDFGGFVGHFNAWRKCVELDEPLLVFEDDAIVPDGFRENVDSFMTEAPDAEMISLCVNDYGKSFYRQRVLFDAYGYHKLLLPLTPRTKSQFDEPGLDRLCWVYQPWTLTANLYWPSAAQSLIDTVTRMGIHMNADAFVHHRARLREFRAYAPKPEYLDLVCQFNEGHSIIQSNKY